MKLNSLQQANNSEQTATSSEEQMTCQYTTTVSSEGDTGTCTAGMKRSSSNDNNRSNRGSEVRRPYDERGYC